MFNRDHHRAIAVVLNAFNPDYFYERRCYFGGGTLLALSFGEYRQSIDIDFLISDPDQIRLLRRDLHDRGYSVLFKKAEPKFPLRPDQPRVTRDKVVFAVQPHDTPLKVEIIFEERIVLDDAREAPFTAMPCLTIRDSIAEKLMANTDRGLDTAYFAKDLIDLAFVVTETEFLDDAVEKVHGSSNRYEVTEPLRRAIEYFGEHADFRLQCYAQLQVSAPRDIADGIDRLAAHLKLPAIERLLEEEPELY